MTIYIYDENKDVVVYFKLRAHSMLFNSTINEKREVVYIL